jgi:hypothetical protein
MGNGQQVFESPGDSILIAEVNVETESLKNFIKKLHQKSFNADELWLNHCHGT